MVFFNNGDDLVLRPFNDRNTCRVPLICKAHRRIQFREGFLIYKPLRGAIYILVL